MLYLCTRISEEKRVLSNPEKQNGLVVQLG